jgi:hypothetical protein
MNSLSRPASAPDSSAGPARRRVLQLAGAGAAASALPAFAAYPDQTMALAPPAADVTTISIEPGVTPTPGTPAQFTGFVRDQAGTPAPRVKTIRVTL